MESHKLRCADALARILEINHVKFIFGHPGEQILPFYDAIRKSKIRHVLMRHEQCAAHAADGYARASASIGVCVSTGGPGAMNLVMGVATAYKDSVPMIIITGDVPTGSKGKNGFQDIDIVAVFKPITMETFDIKSPEEGILILQKAFKTLKYNKTGPIHLNFPKDILESYIDSSILESSGDMIDNCGISINIHDIRKVTEILKNASKPLIIAGAGTIWSHATHILYKFADENSIPVATTYHARGVISEDNPLAIGMIGLRGTAAANYAGKNCDVLLALGCRFSERTLMGIGNCTIIHVNLDNNVLKGDIKINGDVKKFLSMIVDIKLHENENWLSMIHKHSSEFRVKTDYTNVPIKPQRAIKEILDASDDSVIVNDAGTHTTWVTMLKSVKNLSSLIFSGGFGPMGYGVPGAIGASIACPQKTVVAIVGDGDFQMTSQELATIKELELPITICIINNSCLRIIKQWQELSFGETYQVQLENPDFIKLADAYQIPGVKVNSPGEVFNVVEIALRLKKPYLIEIIVDESEKIPLPEVL